MRFNRKKTRFLKRCRYGLEALGGWLICFSFWLFPLDMASAFGAFLGRKIGPFLSASRIARRNLRQVFPDWTEERVRETVRQVWDNLGRIAAEYFHPKDFLDQNDMRRIQVQGEEILQKLKAQQKPILFVGAHFGNWQIATLVLKHHGIPIWQFYRPANNPGIDIIMRFAQRPFVAGILSKSVHSFRHLMTSLKKGLNVLVFFDQYMHKGEPIPFFGRPALTAPVTVRLAKKMQCPLVPFYVERLKGSQFRVTFEPPLDLAQEEIVLLTHLNQRLESWVEARPELWFWVHDRWKQK